MTKRATIEEKKIKKTARKDREIYSLSYDPISEVPEPAFDLNADGQKYFGRFCQILLSNKTLTIADIPIITRAAMYYEIFSDARDSVRINGATQITKTGYTAKNGYFVTMTDAEKRVTEIEALYGMNLTARTKINLPKPEKKNAFDEI